MMTPGRGSTADGMRRMRWGSDFGVLVPNVPKVTVRNRRVFNMLSEAITVGGRFQLGVLRYDLDVGLLAGIGRPGASVGAIFRTLDTSPLGQRRKSSRDPHPIDHIRTNS